MNLFSNLLRRSLGLALIVLLSVAAVLAQQARGTLRGVIKDELGSTIVGASVTLIDSSGAEKTATTNDEGVYSFSGLAPGKYVISVKATGFAMSEDTEVELTTGARQSLDLILKVTIEEQKVTIAAETPLSTEATNNANQTLITGKDLDALPDDPDELAAALQALAGPSMGPNGGQIFVDGFSGGRLPPKESIREIRINQNPFAAENDQPSGRIDVLTRPGTDKVRGSAFFNFQDESFNSRNPFTTLRKRSPFQVRQFGGNLGGPLVKKKASYFIDFERREIDDNELVKATVLDGNLNPLDFGLGVLAPKRNITFSPRFDYQINGNNTLIARYSYNHSSTQNAGVGGFSLPERAYDQSSTQQNVQLTETAVLNATMINEAKFQFTHQTSESLADNTLPALSVSGSFISGGSQVGHVTNSRNNWELQDFLAIAKGNHAFKFGGRLRHVSLSDVNPGNFGGTYTFTGALVPTLDANNQPITNQPIFADSLERYRRTLLGQQLGLTATQIRALGGEPSQFTINSGDPKATVSQTDFGIYAQDDWRVRPNLTFSYGLRYEGQTNIKSILNFAPRLAVAWSPGAANSAKPPKMVIRAGGGVFYNRFGEGNTLQATRFNGVNQLLFSVREAPLYNCRDGAPGAGNPQLECTFTSASGQRTAGHLEFTNPSATPLDAFPALPAVGGFQTQQVAWRVADDLQAPVVYLMGTQVERQLPKRFTLFAGLFLVRIQHSIRARDINAPLAGSITVANPNGTRPFGNVGEIYQYESSGRFNQNQLFIGFNNRFSRALTFFSSYSLSKTSSDTDGQGSNSLFPAYSYDLNGEFGRASFDVRHRFTFAGTLNLPWWQMSLNPFIIATSGAPFNITTGQDANGDRLFTERPSFAPDGVDCNDPPTDIICTRFGNFNRNPGAGETLIPRNYGQGPGFISVNMRISKTWNFGTIHSSASNQTQPEGQGQRGGGGRSAGAGVPRIPGGGGGARGGGGLASIGGPPGGGGAEAKRYSMQFSLNFQNLFNHVNFNTPVGNLSSPSFGESLGLNGGFGGFGGPGGGGGGGGAGGSNGAGNRKVTAQVRFNF